MRALKIRSLQNVNTENPLGLFNWFGVGDVTKNWVARPGLELVVDLDRASLRGVRFEQPIDNLSWLGPAEDPREARGGYLHYYTRGLCVQVRDRRLDAILIFFNIPNFEPFTGKIVYHGGTLPINSSTTEAQTIEWLGQPTDREDDGDDGFSSEYTHNDNWFVLEFNGEKLLKSITVI